ncbi:MAG TPA: argininosuccinate synthase [Polyangia bacterium]|jgi:argininosuccinate synthase|nr:argininosuccinate synthase [Polyangia bacterium]
MKIVLAYSGGLDTSVAIVWLKEKYDAEIVGFCSDVGQGEDLEGARKKALKTGAVSCHVLDQRDEFVRDFVFPAVRAGAVYEGEYYLGTALARPCIARGMMEVAAREGATAIAHGSTGKGNDQVRFELGAYWFNPSIKIIAPWREWDFKSRSELIAFAAAKQIPVEATASKPYSIDRNLLHTSYEGGILEDPDAEPPAEMFQRTADPRKAPDQPREVAIAFEKGSPVSVDGVVLGPAALLTELNAIAGEHGVGRADVVEDRFVGMKSRGVYETPGGTLLHKAHRGVASLTMDREAMRLRDSLSVEYATLAYRGFWFSPEREALQKLVDAVNEPVTGVARLRLYKGSATLIGRSSPRSLYRNDIVTFEDDQGAYDQRDAGGFIRLNGLRLRTSAMVAKGRSDNR